MTNKQSPDPVDWAEMREESFARVMAIFSKGNPKPEQMALIEVLLSNGWDARLDQIARPLKEALEKIIEHELYHGINECNCGNAESIAKKALNK